MHETYLSRSEAAAYCQAKGLSSITARQLEKLAHQRKGPDYWRLGKAVYYTPTSLDVWLSNEMVHMRQTS